LPEDKMEKLANRSGYRKQRLGGLPQTSRGPWWNAGATNMQKLTEILL